MGIKEFLNKEVSPQRVVMFILAAGAVGALGMVLYLSIVNSEKKKDYVSSKIEESVLEAARIGYIEGQRDAMLGEINIEEKDGEWVLKKRVLNIDAPIVAEGSK